MVLKISSPKSGNQSASDYASDPEKEISDDDDDDRNHKHRRREARSQSSDKNVVENASTRPFRNENRSFENGHDFRESKLQTSQYNPASSEKQFPGKFGKRAFESNQRNRANQIYSGDLAFGRGRGRDSGPWNSGPWNYRNNRFTSLDIASQIIPQRAVPPGLFPDRGLPSITNAQSALWSGYGLIPGIPNGGVETLHSIGMQGAFRPALIPQQRCRDFEERGFCLRGDMCPMEHGINRIVVEDVQSLSQFNLPVSLSTGPTLGSPAVPGSLPSMSSASTSMMSNKGPHSRNGKHGIVDGGFTLKSGYSEPGNAVATDLYDPDQPLWNNAGPETSSALLALRSPLVDEAGSLSNDDAFENQMNEAVDIERRDGTTLPVGSQSTSSSIWGRIRNSRGKTSSRISASANVQNVTAEEQGALGGFAGSSDRGKKVIAEDANPKALDSSRVQSDAMHLTRKPTQKALRTLFVNFIPQKNNRREALLSHFQKFGKVIDIYIPINSERAFVQFSKREEAEAAFRAPDAVMGNRFIKLLWANRDRIPDDGISGVTGASSGIHGASSSTVPTALSIPSRGKDNLQSAAKTSDVPARDTFGTDTDQSKFPADNSPKVTPPSQKKLELEQLKEELRKKQEMLDRKRSDFKRQLDKLAKQTVGVKGEDASEQVAKRQKVESASDLNKAASPRALESSAPTPRSSDADASCEEKADDKKLHENGLPGRPAASSLMAPQEYSSSLKRQPRPLAAPPGMPFSPNRYKLDNRPTTFRILPPLPSGLANAAALKEHFSSYGDLTVVELEEIEGHDNPEGSETMKSCSARVGFRDRQTAERAFVNSKSWQGHNLQLAWVAPTGHAKAITTPKSIDNPSAANEPSESDIQSTDKAAGISSELVNGESKHSEREKSVDRAEPAEVSQSVPSSASGGEVD